MSNNLSDTPQVIIFPPLLYVGALLLGLLIHLSSPLPLMPRALAMVLGLVLTVSATTLLAAAVQAMQQAGTNINPNQPTTMLVEQGPFRFSRNPIYLGFTLLYAGISMIANGLWMVLPLPIILAVMHFGVIAREEKYLEHKFGTDYWTYKSRVRRWI